MSNIDGIGGSGMTTVGQVIDRKRFSQNESGSAAAVERDGSRWATVEQGVSCEDGDSVVEEEEELIHEEEAEVGGEMDAEECADEVVDDEL